MGGFVSLNERQPADTVRCYPPTKRSLELTRTIIEKTMALAETDEVRAFWQPKLDEIDRQIERLNDGEV